jgi:hypothetical protein
MTNWRLREFRRMRNVVWIRKGNRQDAPGSLFVTVKGRATPLFVGFFSHLASEAPDEHPGRVFLT